MNHPRILSLLFVMAMATLLAAQEPQQGDKEKKGPDAKGKDQPDLAARVAKNMKAAEERLKQSDPGDVTRKIQRDVVDDLDEMIKQNDKSQGGKSGQRSQRQQSGKKGDQSDSKSGLDQQPGNPQDGKGDEKNQQEPDKQHGTAKGGKKDDGQGKDKDQGKESGKEGLAKNDGDKDKDKGNVKGQPGGKDGKDSLAGGQGSSKRDSDKAKRDLTAELNRVPWGKLPDKMRLEMDVYSKERFMPRYDDLLRQYYRSIAEQSMKKDD
jgi:hypothetical protein